MQARLPAALRTVPEAAPHREPEKYDVPMPIVDQVNEVLFEGKPAAEAVQELMLRDKTKEANTLTW